MGSLVVQVLWRLFLMLDVTSVCEGRAKAKGCFPPTTDLAAFATRNALPARFLASLHLLNSPGIPHLALVQHSRFKTWAMRSFNHLFVIPNTCVLFVEVVFFFP